jgi:hypothetical protein
MHEHRCRLAYDELYQFKDKGLIHIEVLEEWIEKHKTLFQSLSSKNSKHTYFYKFRLQYETIRDTVLIFQNEGIAKTIIDEFYMAGKDTNLLRDWYDRYEYFGDTAESLYNSFDPILENECDVFKVCNLQLSIRDYKNIFELYTIFQKHGLEIKFMRDDKRNEQQKHFQDQGKERPYKDHLLEDDEIPWI